MYRALVRCCQVLLRGLLVSVLMVWWFSFSFLVKDLFGKIPPLLAELQGKGLICSSVPWSRLGILEPSVGASQRELRLDCQPLPAVGRTLTAYLAGLELDLKSAKPARAGGFGQGCCSQLWLCQP